LPKRSRGTAGHAASSSVFIDSSAWIAFFSARDQHHADADRLFRRALETRRSLVTTNLVVAEIHRLLLYRAGIRAAMAALAKIEASSYVKIEFPGDSHHQAALLWLAKLAPNPVSYADAISFAVMETLGCTEAISYDAHFQQAGFSLWQPNR
jgi:predicted nucleic acid-binding protein